MSRKKNESPVKAAAISLFLTCVVLFSGIAYIDSMTAALLVKKLLWPLLRLSAVIAAGLFMGQFIEAAGWTRYIAFIAGPLFRFANLKEQCGAAFTTAFFSGAASNAMLMDYYNDGIINKKELYLTNFINHVPTYFLHFPTTFFIVIPLTGKAGMYYFGLTFAALVLRTFFFLLYGRLNPGSAENGDHEKAAGKEETKKKKHSAVLEAVMKKLPNRLLRVMIHVVPIYVIIFMVNALGLFDLARNKMAGFMVSTFIPVESLSIVVLGFVAEFSSGFAAAGALMEAGAITAKETALALLIGNIIAFPIRALRHQIPRYMGIFEPRMGLQLLLMGQMFRIVSLMAVGYGFYLAW